MLWKDLDFTYIWANQVLLLLFQMDRFHKSITFMTLQNLLIIELHVFNARPALSDRFSDQNYEFIILLYISLIEYPAMVFVIVYVFTSVQTLSVETWWYIRWYCETHFTEACSIWRTSNLCERSDETWKQKSKMKSNL